MKYCGKCQKQVNVSRNTVDIGIAEVWQDNCEECGNFIESGVEHVKDISFDMSRGKDKCKVSFEKDKLCSTCMFQDKEEICEKCDENKNIYTMMFETTERDYPEYFHEENGIYQNTCMECEKKFIGRKRSKICKVCMEV